jgi:hypothetical protein
MTDIWGPFLKTFHSVVAVGQMNVDILVLRLRVLQILRYNSSENSVWVIISTQNILNATHLHPYTLCYRSCTGRPTAALLLPVLRPTSKKRETELFNISLNTKSNWNTKNVHCREITDGPSVHPSTNQFAVVRIKCTFFRYNYVLKAIFVI